MSRVGQLLAGRAADALTRRREGRPGIGDADASNEGTGRTALVTGASSGIGWAMCELLAAKSYDIVPVARREDRLKELQVQLEERWGVHVHPLPCDLGEAGAAAHIRDELDKRGLTVDVLVNNAGYMLHGNYLDNPWEAQLRFARVLAITVSELCHHLLPHMVEQRWGRVINITSVAGVMAGTPGMTLYSPAKAFTHKMSEGLSLEYEPYGVHCTVSVVGATDTELMRTKDIWDFTSQNPMLQLSMMRADTVARQAYGACMRGRRVVVNGWPNRAWTFVIVHSPPSVRYGLVKFTAKMSPHPRPGG